MKTQDIPSHVAGRPINRRTLLLAALARGTTAPGCTMAPRTTALTHSARPGAPFDPDAFSIAGVFDADWLLDARFSRLLDTMAASPGAFGTVRVFGMLNAGEREAVAPTSSGRVWPALDAPMDFSIPLAALNALISRNMTPFVVLSFFPRAVSAGPVTPPDGFVSWQRLVQAFLDAVAARYGRPAMAQWWFEVWNEPNMPPFWAGSFDQYLDLYRATSEAVLASGHTLRLGGPVLAYRPGEGAPLMDRFLDFLHREPRVKCDFISLHRKGSWTADEVEPRLDRLELAARQTANSLLRLAPERARGMAIVNDEADMKVAFDTPYEPRMTEQFPAWLAASAILHDRLSAEYSGAGIRFLAAADHANQHLVQAPFDGRRSVMTRLSTDPADLVKLPVFHFHEMLRLLGRRHGTVPAHSALPSGLFDLVTVSDGSVAALLTFYPEDTAAAVEVDYTLRDLPWPRVNLVRLGINPGLSNSYTAVGRSLLPAITDPASIRAAAELGAVEPIQSAIVPVDGALQMRLRLVPFETILVWITPTRLQPPLAPTWLETSSERRNTMLRWTPGREVDVYSYTVRRDGQLISPVPLRSAIWVDAASPPGRHTYGISAISTSGVTSTETYRRIDSQFG